jgi:UDP-glucose 4-epimerase
MAPWSRAVVTGAGGFIGQHLVQYLRALKIPVVGIGRSKAGPAVTEVADLRRPGALAGILDEQTALFHLAGPADIRGSIKQPMADFEDNVTLSMQVLESARVAGCRLIFPSTASVYDPAATLPFVETAAVRPRSPYAAAKLAVEAYCQAYHRSYGLDVCIGRMCSVYGPGMRRLAIHDFVERLDRFPQRLVLRGDGGQTRDYLYVDDAVRALHLIATHGSAGEIYNLASGQSMTVREVALRVAEAMGLHDCKITADGNNSETEAYALQADIDKIRKFGFRPAMTFEQGLAITVSSLRSS